jgi:hypothetical protein
MNDHSDIERVLTTWFDDGPSTMPDRVVDVVADRIGRQSQRRAWRLERRLLEMNPYLKFGVAAAAVVLIAVIGYNLLPASPSRIGGPGSAATSSPSPTSSPLALPDGRLEARDYVARALPGDPMAFTITAPQGWTGFGGFFIGGPHLSDAPSGIGISFNHDPQVVTDPCDASPHTPSPGSSAPSVDDLVAAISAREDLQVSGVTDAVLAGFTGKRLDLQFPAKLACDNQYVFAEPKGLYANGPANRWRVWLLDVDGETAVVVLLDYAATPAEDRAAAQAAIDSVRITP